MNNKAILFEEIHGPDASIGLITLNRPQALNALTHAMCLKLHAQLHDWANAKHIKAVIIRGAGEKAFCAGGDIRQIYELGKNGDLTTASQFFWDEYRLNHCIHHFPKPYLALLDGITMGGGVGVSIHGSYRIASERLLFAMPETGIGFFPDIGGSYFLSRCPGKTGVYLALTGARLTTADAHYLGLVNYVTSAQYFDDIIQTLANTVFDSPAHTTISTVLQQFNSAIPPAPLAAARPLIDQHFAHDTITAIEAALAADTDAWCQKQLALLATKSPTSLLITLRALQKGATMDFDACMQMEYQLAYHCLQRYDFYEGIRAAVIDKDQQPHWRPTHIKEIATAEIEQYFSIPPNKILEFY